MYKPPVTKSRASTQATNRKIPGNKNDLQRSVPLSSDLTQTRRYSAKNLMERKTLKYEENSSYKDKAKKPQPRSMSLSSLERYNKSKIETSYMPYKRAPSNQFKRYLDDSQNIFWQNSYEVRQLKLLRYIKYCLLALFFFLITTYFLIGRIQPWPQGQCPEHAHCGVFVHCKRGFVRENNRCIIDPSLRHIAEKTCTAVVQQLQLDYGNQDCTPSQNASVPQKRIRQIVDQFKITESLVIQGIYQFFQSSKNQKAFGFNTSSFAVKPTKKMYSFSCRCQLFTESRHFYWMIVILMISSMAAGYIFKWLNFKRKAQKAYEYLRAMTIESEAILIQAHKAAVIKIANEWNNELWQEVDRLRCQQRKIVYFLEHDQLYWKMYQQI